MWCWPLVRHVIPVEGEEIPLGLMVFGSMRCGPRHRRDFLCINFPWLWWKHFRTAETRLPVYGWHRPVFGWVRVVDVEGLTTEQLRFKLWWVPVVTWSR